MRKENEQTAQPFPLWHQYTSSSHCSLYSSYEEFVKQSSASLVQDHPFLLTKFMFDSGVTLFGRKLDAYHSKDSPGVNC